MAYDEALAERVRDRVGAAPGAAEKRMFGGLAFLDHGRITVCAMPDGLLVRVGRQAAGEAQTRPGAREARMGDRPMDGWIVVDPAALDDEALDYWIGRARDLVQTLPPK